MRITLAIALAMIFPLASAFQVYKVHNGSELTASVYKSGLSRIYLKDDRISAIKAMAGEFQIDKNDEIGDIYIKPLSTRSSDALDLFIQSERGNTYALRLKVSADKPESIRLEADDLADINSDAMINEAQNTQAEVIELIKVASLNQEIKGYSKEVFEKPSPLRLKKNVASVLERSYFGRNYRIDVLRIENNTNGSAVIQERDLADIPNVVAVSLESRTLSEGENTLAYRVVKL